MLKFFFKECKDLLYVIFFFGYYLENEKERIIMNLSDVNKKEYENVLK